MFMIHQNQVNRTASKRLVGELAPLKITEATSSILKGELVLEGIEGGV